MPHATHNARRSGSSPVPHAPRQRHTFQQKQLLMALCTGLSMLAIGGLYAVSFRHSALFASRASAKDAPRWSSISEEFFMGVRPVVKDLGDVRAGMTRIILAAQLHKESLRLLQEKISAGGATTTSAIP